MLFDLLSSRTHPFVKDAAVIGHPDELSSEVPRAFVVKQDEADKITSGDIYNWVKERVAPYKRLDGGVEFVSEIPKSASGKILRRVLKEHLLEELE